MLPWHENVCRICLWDDSKTYTVVGTELEAVYERITGYKWVQEDRPVKICYICRSQLQRTLKLNKMSKESEGIFSQMLSVGFEFTKEILPILSKRRIQILKTTSIATLDINPTVLDIPDIALEETKTRKSTLETCSLTSTTNFSFAPTERNLVQQITSTSAEDTVNNSIGMSPIEKNTCEHDFDIKVEIKSLEEGLSEASPEKISATDFEKTTPRKENSNSIQKRKRQHEEAPESDISNSWKHTLLENNALVYIPSSEISTLSPDKNSTSEKTIHNNSETIVNKLTEANAKNYEKNCNNITKSTHSNSICKNLTLIYSPNDIITPRKRLENIMKKKSELNTKILRLNINKSQKNHGENYTESNKRLKNVEVSKSIEINYKHTVHKLISKSNQNTENRGSYLCHECNKKFTNKYLLETHIASHTSQKPFRCDICDHTFAIKKYILLHMKKHTNIRPFHCQKCSKKFTRASYLTKHLQRTHGKMVYKCDMCKKSFNQPSNLKQHQRTHTGEKPYACSFCVKRFGQLSNLLQHQRIHSGERPYVCACGKAFTQKSGLDQHRRINGCK